MQLKDLAYYVALTEQKNFSLVATQFHVSQPTISAAIRRLETELQTQLLIRDNPHQPLVLTTTGQQVRDHAKLILHQANLMHLEVQHSEQQRLVIGMPPIIEITYLPRVARQLPPKIFKQLAPISQGSLAALKSLKSGQFDVAFLGYLDALAEPALTIERFDRQPFSIIVARDHPLASQPEIAFQTLRQTPFIALKHNFVHRQAFQQLARQNHIQPPILFESNEIQGVLNMVANQVGIALLSNAVPIDKTALVRIPLSDTPAPMFNVGLAYRQDTTFSPVQQQLLTQIRTAFGLQN
ncbi:LysR family transcriptional regulator [Lactiplantibacillus daowaiensis]|uniref:LysR family transcriptional regulator n=1 Tax=Lactiplantibacillus daowaiensis TaxID=2559918 RepID=A0ABW1RWZ1_9LACO|nr:LysR family transcriptional regulator [Lactiplantibacillus daowaiensis]